MSFREDNVDLKWSAPNSLILTSAFCLISKYKKRDVNVFTASLNKQRRIFLLLVKQVIKYKKLKDLFYFSNGKFIREIEANFFLLVKII